MEYFECQFGTYASKTNTVPVPETLQGKDTRADSAARAAVLSASAVIDKLANIDFSSLCVIVVNRQGCRSHINKVSAGISKKIARQGFFVRGGPQTLATYTALALGSHGATFTLVGDKQALDTAISTAFYLASHGDGTAVLLTVVADSKAGGLQAISALVRAKDKNHSVTGHHSKDCRDLFEKFAEAFH